MTQINLIPWREKKREQEKKYFLSILLICILIDFFVIFLVHVYVANLMGNQITRNNMLRKEIFIMDDQIKEIKNLQKIREILIARMSIIQHLQSTRTLMVHLFDELIKIIPYGAYFTQIKEKNKYISFIGYAKSNTSISILMKNIERNEWLHTPVLNKIKRREKQQTVDYEFKLTCLLAPSFQVGKTL